MLQHSRSSPFSTGTLIAQKYRLVQPLGEGGMGVVWSAVNEHTGGEVALKLVVRPEAELRLRLLREARAAGAVRHRNLLQIHDVDLTDAGDPFLVMELLCGDTLAARVCREGRLPPREAAGIARDIARGLDALHEKGIVHRDLKPANVILHLEPGGDGPVVKVLDLGVSKNLVITDDVQTLAGTTLGSPAYMSPEQAKGDPAIDGRTDVWALGIVLFEMLTGERPFVGEPIEVLHRVLTADTSSLSERLHDVEPRLARLVSECLCRRREDRLWPASQIATRLHAVATSRSGLASSCDSPPPSRERSPAAPALPRGSEVSTVTAILLHPEPAPSTPERPRPAPLLPAPAPFLPVDSPSGFTPFAHVAGIAGALATGSRPLDPPRGEAAPSLLGGTARRRRPEWILAAITSAVLAVAVVLVVVVRHRTPVDVPLEMAAAAMPAPAAASAARPWEPAATGSDRPRLPAPAATGSPPSAVARAPVVDASSAAGPATPPARPSASPPVKVPAGRTTAGTSRAPGKGSAPKPTRSPSASTPLPAEARSCACPGSRFPKPSCCKVQFQPAQL